MYKNIEKQVGYTIKELEPDAAVIEDGFTVSEHDDGNAEKSCENRRACPYMDIAHSSS